MIVRQGGIGYYPGGREVCLLRTRLGRETYKNRLYLMWLRQNKKCRICWKPLLLIEATFDHENGRGMGGSQRDDRIVLPGGVLLNGAAHLDCNRKKGSKRGYDD